MHRVIDAGTVIVRVNSAPLKRRQSARTTGPMAPKKAKKGKKQASEFPDPEDAEDIGLGDSPEPTAAAAKPKTSAPKKKKGKKALKAGDWSDEEPRRTKELYFTTRRSLMKLQRLHSHQQLHPPSPCWR